MSVIQQQFAVSYSFPVVFTRDVFDTANRSLLDVLQSAGPGRNRVMVVIDANLFACMPQLVEKIEAYGREYRDLIEFVDSPCLIAGGEVCKKGPAEVEKLQAHIEKYHICRHSYVLAIGGGAVLDAAGFAAATAHRGIRFIRMPTTTLAQNDAGVGVKNGINAFGRKNFLGTFAPPFAVINDFDFLAALPERDMRAGIAEAVKVSLIKDRSFFESLYRERNKLAAFEPKAMERMIIRCAELHMEHIGRNGDPFEHGSARPLDFGHWSAHKLEELTGGEIKHGEAVAVGIALDSLYSHRLGFIDDLELSKILATLEGIGFDLYHWALGWIDVEKALGEFQEHLGGELTITLLDGIGRGVEVHRIEVDLLRSCIEALAARRKGKEGLDGRGKEPVVGAGDPRRRLS